MWQSGVKILEFLEIIYDVWWVQASVKQGVKQIDAVTLKGTFAKVSVFKTFSVLGLGTSSDYIIYYQEPAM